MNSFDTICAISTSLGESAINIIRLSGKDAIDISMKVLSGVDLTKKKGNTISYAKVVENGEIIDEVLVSLFRAPKSYTKEDIVEINTHGGQYVTERVLELLLLNGARLAEPGEFTKRAFLNGRIDLSKAEAVMDMIEAQTKASLSLASKGLKGDVYKEISALRKDIEDILLHIEVNIDYPEYTDELQVTKNLLIEKVTSLINTINNIILKAENLRVYKEGIKTIIIGKPNVGKSSLLNNLLKENKAIVTSYKGTTRDIVEGNINIGGIILHLIDTAGVRDTVDPVEKIGIDKTIEVLKDAELVLLLLDYESGIEKEDLALLELTKDKNRIIIANKSDTINKKLNENEYLSISALKGDGIEALEKEIHKRFIHDEANDSIKTNISSSRHISLLKLCEKSLSSALTNAENGDFIDMISIDLKDAYDSLGLITGESASDSLINELFSKFCLGK